MEPVPSTWLGGTCAWSRDMSASLDIPAKRAMPIRVRLPLFSQKNSRRRKGKGRPGVMIDVESKVCETIMMKLWTRWALM